MSKQTDLPSQHSSTARLETAIDSHDALEHIRVAAFFRAEARGFVPGHELEDWATAEQQLQRPNSKSPQERDLSR